MVKNAREAAIGAGDAGGLAIQQCYCPCCLDTCQRTKSLCNRTGGRRHCEKGARGGSRRRRRGRPGAGQQPGGQDPQRAARRGVGGQAAPPACARRTGSRQVSLITLNPRPWGIFQFSADACLTSSCTVPMCTRSLEPANTSLSCSCLLLRLLLSCPTGRWWCGWANATLTIKIPFRCCCRNRFQPVAGRWSRRWGSAKASAVPGDTCRSRGRCEKSAFSCRMQGVMRVGERAEASASARRARSLLSDSTISAFSGPLTVPPSLSLGRWWCGWASAPRRPRQRAAHRRRTPSPPTRRALPCHVSSVRV